jgi:hypothetical protein
MGTKLQPELDWTRPGAQFRLHSAESTTVKQTIIQIVDITQCNQIFVEYYSWNLANNFCQAPKHTYTSWVCTKFYYIHKDTLLYQLIVITTSTDAPATSVLDHSTHTIIIFISNTHKQAFSVYHKCKSIASRPRKPSLILHWINIVYLIFSCSYCSLNSITHSTIISQTIPNSCTIRIWTI